MPKPSPEEIYISLKSGKIAIGTALDLLISYIKNSDEEAERFMSVKLLNQLEIINEKYYSIFEELLVSDSNSEINEISTEIIAKHFFERGKDSIRWVLDHYNSPYRLAGVLHALFRAKPDFLREYLLAELDNFILGHIQKVRHLHKSFFRGLTKDYNALFESKKLEEFSTEHLMNILINFETVIFISVYHEQASDLGVKFKDGYVVEINMRHSPYEVERISDIKGIFNFAQIEGLFIKFAYFKDLDGIENFAKLKKLILGQNDLEEISYIDNLKNLEVLSLLDSKLSEIPNLKGLNKLKHLNFTLNSIEEIKGLDHLKNLELLILSFNKIKEIKGLDNLKKLKRLALAGNNITSIHGLENLINLENLDLTENKIKKIRGLERLKKLKELRLDNNEIEVLENIENLKVLKYLTISANKISKVDGLEERLNPIVISMEENLLSDKLIKYIRELTNKKKKIVLIF
jgi:Leucine-rich repeat (LRR) protein